MYIYLYIIARHPLTQIVTSYCFLKFIRAHLIDVEFLENRTLLHLGGSVLY